MTIEKFLQTRFGQGDQVKWDGKVYPVKSVDFDECLIGIQEEHLDEGEINWKRCENCELIKL